MFESRLKPKTAPIVPASMKRGFEPSVDIYHIMGVSVGNKRRAVRLLHTPPQQKYESPGEIQIDIKF
jgi:hypothetical protein